VNLDNNIALCGCCFLPEKYKERTPDKWHKYLLDLANKLANNKYEINIAYFNNKFNIEYPILIEKYLKK